MKKKLLKIAAISILLILILSFTVQAVPEMNFVIENGKHIKTPVCYSCTQTISYLGDNIGNFIDASDIFIDKKDNIYIADTVNNRIIMLDKDGNYLRDYTNGGMISGPKSVYVTDNGDLFVSDSKNEQVVHLGKEDKEIEKFGKPESELLSDIVDFSVGRIAISEQGLIYLINSQQFMMIDANNEFKGYVGANKVSFNLKEFFIRTFGSEIQKNKMVTQQAASYNSFEIGDNGLIYAVANDSANQIRVLNVDGDNIFPAGVYGERVEEDKSTWTREPIFVDICVDKNGIIHTLERHSGQIYTYNLKGEMIVAYGGIGSIIGKFLNPVAIDMNSNGEVYVLDGATGTIHKFTPTSYMNSILDAYKLFEDGKYQESMEKWNDVLDINVNCSLANSSMGNILYKQKEFKDAMNYYKNANDKSGYAKAFSKYRHELFREYFGWIVVAAALLIVGIYLVVRQMFKKGKKVSDDYYYSGGKKR